jgi:hypothetical protein
LLLFLWLFKILVSFCFSDLMWSILIL